MKLTASRLSRSAKLLAARACQQGAQLSGPTGIRRNTPDSELLVWHTAGWCLTLTLPHPLLTFQALEASIEPEVLPP
jgi:hypothetical protein